MTLRVDSTDSKIEFPISLIISAAGFESWKGRGSRVGKSWVSKFGNNEAGSLGTIMHYGSLTTPIPPVGDIYV